MRAVSAMAPRIGRQLAAQMQPPPVVILVHGAWHGPWAWAEVIERLTAEGIRTIAVDLPSKGSETALLGDLHDDAEAVRAAVDAAGAPALVVAHSYGGLPVERGPGRCANAAHLLYLAAFMLEPGRVAARPARRRRLPTGGSPPRTAARCSRTTRSTSSSPTARPRWPSARPRARAPAQATCSRQELRAAAWQTVPSTYVVCERDNAIPPALQERMAQRAGTVSRIDAGHSAVPVAARRGHGDHPGDARGGRRGG